MKKIQKSFLDHFFMSRHVQYFYMTIQLMHKLLDISGYIFEEMTNQFDSSRDLGREFWAYLKSKILDDITKKIKVSDFVYDKILDIDAYEFDNKYSCCLENVKKSKAQMEFVSNIVTQMLKHSSINQIIDWS